MDSGAINSGAIRNEELGKPEAKRSSLQSLFNKYVDKKTVAAIALLVIGGVVFYNRGRLPVKPLACRTDWINYANAKKAGKAVAKVAVVGVLTLAGFIGGDCLASDLDEEVRRLCAAAGSIGSTGVACVGCYTNVIPATGSLIASGVAQAYKVASTYYMVPVKLVALAIVCFKVLPSLARFYREDVLRAERWKSNDYEGNKVFSNARLLQLASFALGCFALFGTWSLQVEVDKDLLKKAVAVGIGVSIPVLANNLTHRGPAK